MLIKIGCEFLDLARYVIGYGLVEIPVRSTSVSFSQLLLLGEEGGVCEDGPEFLNGHHWDAEF
jgi:hypothetical protein